MAGNDDVTGAKGKTLSDRELYLRDWEVSVTPIEDARQFADQAAVDYAHSGIKSAYILNGGALVFLPPFSSMFQVVTSCNKIYLLYSAIFFTCGLLCAIATTVLAYFTMFFEGVGCALSREAVARRINMRYYGKDDENSEEMIKKSEEIRDKSFGRRNKIHVSAFVTGGLSAISFIAGAAMLLYLAWH